MAKAYKAVTRIKHGQTDGKVVEFAPGERVSGLSKEEMKSLWDAGALEAVEVETTPSRPEKTDEEKAAEEKAAADASASKATSEGGDV